MMNRSMPPFALAVMFALCMTANARAQTPPAAVSACQACHGADGISSRSDIPNLAGQKRDYLLAQLQAFKKGGRKNDLMAAIAGQLGDEDMKALASWWSTRSAAAPATPAASTTIAARMTFPTDFPKGYTVYETVTDANSGAVTRRWANSAALNAAREGKPLSDGATIIVANHARADAPAASFAAMEIKSGWGDAVPELLRNGDWGYATFDAQGQRNDRVDQAGCLACHRPVAADSYVFSLKALAKRATTP